MIDQGHALLRAFPRSRMAGRSRPRPRRRRRWTPRATQTASPRLAAERGAPLLDRLAPERHDTRGTRPASRPRAARGRPRSGPARGPAAAGCRGPSGTRAGRWPTRPRRPTRRRASSAVPAPPSPPETTRGDRRLRRGRVAELPLGVREGDLGGARSRTRLPPGIPSPTSPTSVATRLGAVARATCSPWPRRTRLGRRASAGRRQAGEQGVGRPPRAAISSALAAARAAPSLA